MEKKLPGWQTFCSEDDDVAQFATRHAKVQTYLQTQIFVRTSCVGGCGG